MSGVKFNVGVINYGGLPSAGSGLLAARPAAGVVGRIYIASDSLLLYRDTGSSWATIGGSGGITGSGAAGQATFWTGASAVSGDNTFFWDNTNKRLGLGTVTPGVRLDIHGATNTLVQINGTGTTNSYIDFQLAGTSQFRVGHNYNGASRQFVIIDTVASLIPFFINSSGNVNNNGVQIGNDGTYGAPYKSITFGTNNTDGNNRIFASTDTTTGIYIAAATGRGLFFRVNGSASDSMNISPSGNVGVGYSASNLNLAVLGSIYQGSNTANSNFQMLCNQNFYTVGFSPNFSTYTSATVNISVSSNLGTGYVFKTTATITVNLPAASGLNNQLYFVVLTGTTVTVNRSGSDVFINNAGTSVTSLTLVGHTKTLLYSDGGTTWYQLF